MASIFASVIFDGAVYMKIIYVFNFATFLGVNANTEIMNLINALDIKRQSSDLVYQSDNIALC